MKTNTRFWFSPLLIGLVFAILTLGGCSGDDGAPGAPGQDVDPATVDDLQAQIDALELGNVESCVVCHSDDGSVALSGAGHQAEYEQFYQDQALRVINLTYSNNGTQDIVTFQMLKKDENGVDQPFDCNDATTNPEPDLSDALNIYFTQYTDPGFEIIEDVGGPGYAYNWVSLKGTLVYNSSTNVCTSTKDESILGDLNDGSRNGVISVFGRDETLAADPAKHIANPKYPFASMMRLPTATPGNVDYVSKANASGCEGCHTRPFLKHAYIYGEVDDGTNNNGNDFYVCKSCHIDNGTGGHVDWQILKDDPERYADLVNNPVTPEEKVKYAYTTRLMNDVHMSHNMEFGFPQSMQNCNTCHESKLSDPGDPIYGVLADVNYTAETCISCHAVDTLIAKMKVTALGQAAHLNVVDRATLDSTDCLDCHDGGTSAPRLRTIHNGYNPRIYAYDNATHTATRYSDTFTVTIDDTSSFDAATNTLTVKFSAAEVPDIPGLAVTDIVPTVVIGLYGYNTKDFIVAAHGRDADRNRLLEYPVDGTVNPRFTTVTAANGVWEITADLSMWADMITDGVIKRAELAVLPRLDNADGDSLGLNAPSRTFDLAANDFDDDYYPDIVNVADGCNSCHDQLATTFHNGSRGGNIKACRLCHVPSSGGSHLEMQSRSIDSYVHAIHSFQVFDIGDIDFSDPVEALEHQHHISAEFPRFGIMNCESCHFEGMYGVPDQSKSLPGVLSASDDVADRNIGTVSSVVTGPAARACSACHRAEYIKEDDAGKLAAFDAHTKVFGYRVKDDDGVWDRIVEAVMSLF